MTCIKISIHEVLTAKFRPVDAGGFGSIDIGEYPHEITLMITATREQNLQFLYQLAQATEAAIKYVILKAPKEVSNE